MLVNFRKKEYGAISMKNPESGFSLVELTVVSVILIIISAIAIPNIMQANRNYQLDGAGHSVASLLQQARMQAVKNNLPQYAQYTAGGLAFVNDGSTTTYAVGNPDVALAGTLTFNAAPTANHSQLDAFIGGTSPQVGGTIGFNARGLPCTANGNTCPSGSTGFEWFVQNANNGWEAVTVTPSGRIKSWRLNQATNGTCGYAACWQ
jgi:Tfp pilus assembly protein FimT